MYREFFPSMKLIFSCYSFVGKRRFLLLDFVTVQNRRFPNLEL